MRTAGSGGSEATVPQGREKARKAASRKPGMKPGMQGLDVKKVRLGMAVLLVVVAVVVGAIAIFGGGSSDDSPAPAGSAETNAVALSESELLARVSSLAQPAFWVGPRAGTSSYELSTTPDGRVYIRYLTGGAEAGDPRPNFLTVGTYPVDEAQTALRDASRAAKGKQSLSKQNGYEVLSASEANDAYVVFDNQPNVQIEVFSPQAGEAAELAKSGALKPVG
jgi:hypothetical protein